MLHVNTRYYMSSRVHIIDRMASIPQNLIIGKDRADENLLYLMCNQFAPLSETYTEAFMFIVKYTLDFHLSYTVKIFWHDGTIETLTGMSSFRLDAVIRQYYPIHTRDVIISHQVKLSDKSAAGIQLAATISSLNNAVTTHIKTKLNEIIGNSVKAKTVNTHIAGIIKPKLANIIKELDGAYTRMFGDPPSPADTTVFDFDAQAIISKTNTEIMVVVRHLTEENKAWAVSELKRLLRITINDYFQSILENPRKPLQSSFCIDTNHPRVTLHHIDDALTQLIAAAYCSASSSATAEAMRRL